jgi:hypothetical protein
MRDQWDRDRQERLMKEQADRIIRGNKEAEKERTNREEKYRKEKDDTARKEKHEKEMEELNEWHRMQKTPTLSERVHARIAAEEKLNPKPKYTPPPVEPFWEKVVGNIVGVIGFIVIMYVAVTIQKNYDFFSGLISKFFSKIF